MSGLLSGVLPWLYSKTNQLQRNVGGLLTDPKNKLLEMGGLLGESSRQTSNKLMEAFGDPQRPFRVTNEPALNAATENVLANLLGFAPAGMTREVVRYLPAPSSLNTPPVPAPEVMQQFGRVESVPLSMARGTQSKMDWDRFRRGDTPGPLVKGYADKPVAVRREDGEYLIFDGHHRTVDAMNKGAGSLDMYVVDARAYAPQAAGRKPLPSTVDTDELLRELLGR